MPLINEIQAVTDDYIAQLQPVDVFFKSNVMLYKLLSRGNTYNGGKKIQCNLEIAMTNAGSYGPTSELPVQKKEILTAAFFEYAAYFSTLTIDMDDDLMNSGDAALVNLVHTKMRNAEKSIRESMATQIFQSRATNIAADPRSRPFCGLADLFNTTAATTYGEIAESELSLWKAKKVTDAKVMSFPVMQEIRRFAGVDVNEEGKPNLYVTTETLQDAFEATLQQQARYTSQGLAKAGFSNVLFRGCPLVADGKVAEKSLYALNLRFLDIKTHSKRNFTRPQWLSPDRQPDTATANIRWAGQLVCSNRAAHALYTNISAS